MPSPGAKDLLERRLRALSPHGDEHVRAPEDLSTSVMARLPQGTPLLYRKVATLVLEAWSPEGLGLREQLRAEPRATLSARGLDLPSDTTVVIVPPTQVVLPTADRLELPIGDPAPPGAEAPRSVEDARSLLLRTEWRWLLQAPADPWPQSEPLVTARPEHAQRGFRDGRRWWHPPRSVTPAWALLGAVGIVLLLLWSGTGSGLGLVEGTGEGISGTAAASPPWALLAVAVLTVVAVYWWSSRRGG